MTPFDALIGTELELVEKALQQTLTGSDLEASVNALCLNMVNAGGKRIRPAMVLLCAKAAPYYDPERDQDRAVKLAAAVELLHTATLIHDDVIDNSSLRRGILRIPDGTLEYFESHSRPFPRALPIHVAYRIFFALDGAYLCRRACLHGNRGRFLERAWQDSRASARGLPATGGGHHPQAGEKDVRKRGNPHRDQAACVGCDA